MPAVSRVATMRWPAERGMMGSPFDDGSGSAVGPGSVLEAGQVDAQPRGDEAGEGGEQRQEGEHSGGRPPVIAGRGDEAGGQQRNKTGDHAGRVLRHSDTGVAGVGGEQTGHYG